MDDFDVIHRRLETQETETYSSRDLPMSYQNGIDTSRNTILYDDVQCDKKCNLLV